MQHLVATSGPLLLVSAFQHVDDLILLFFWFAVDIELDSLHTRRQPQTKKTVQSDRQQAGTLPTLPVTNSKRTVQQSVTDRLRSANKLPCIFAKTIDIE